MMLLVFWTSAILACYFLLVSVHEVGHYLAGWAAGIPAAEMRIRLFTFPQYVALRDGERWVLPFDLESYLAVMRRHLLTTPRLYLYTAGGMLLETMPPDERGKAGLPATGMALRVSPNPRAPSLVLGGTW